MNYKDRAMWSYAIAVLVGIASFFFPNYLSVVQVPLWLILGALNEIAFIIEKKK